MSRTILYPLNFFAWIIHVLILQCHLHKWAWVSFWGEIYSFSHKRWLELKEPFTIEHGTSLAVLFLGDSSRRQNGLTPCTVEKALSTVLRPIRTPARWSVAYSWPPVLRHVLYNPPILIATALHSAVHQRRNSSELTAHNRFSNGFSSVFAKVQTTCPRYFFRSPAVNWRFQLWFLSV